MPTPSSPASSAALPPASAQAAIVLGFLVGTWALVDGFHRIITGSFLLPPTHAVALNGAGLVVLGALWMLAGNLYLFQNRGANRLAMLALTLASLPFLGWMDLLLLAQLLLLLWPAAARPGHA